MAARCARRRWVRRSRASTRAIIRDIPGVVHVVHQGAFVGVVAETEWAAIRAARDLKVTWSNWAGLPDQARLWEHVRATPVAQVQVTSDRGDPAAAIQGAARRVSAHLRLRHPHPWLDGAVLRGGGIRATAS